MADLAEKMLDVAIVGAGIAGLSASLTLKARNKDVCIFRNENVSKKISKAEVINNYPGFPAIKGSDLADNLIKHAESVKVDFVDEQIMAIYAMGDYYSLLSSKNVYYKAKCVIIATGVSFGKSFDGEDRFLGRGVSYCATCDAFAYKDKQVAVVATSKNAIEEVKFLSEVAKNVYFIPAFKDYEDTFGENVTVIDDKVVSIEGGLKVEKIVLSNRELLVDGVFIIRESVAVDKLVPGLSVKDNFIEVNRAMETNLPGCFACGDVVGAPFQYVKAAGEGNVAALSAVQYLGKMKTED